MLRWVAAILASLALTLGPTAVPPAKAAEQVDLLIVLAADVSRSIDDQKFELERRGYAAALSDPRVLQAIAAGPNGRIAIAFVEWAGANSQKLLIDWTLVRDGNDTKLFVNRLLEAPRSFADRTAIGAGIDFARAQFARSPYASDRRVIDVSGDGTNNSGRDVRAASDDAVGNEGDDHQRARHPHRHADPLQPRAHEPAGRPRELLPRECDRGARTPS